MVHATPLPTLNEYIRVYLLSMSWGPLHPYLLSIPSIDPAIRIDASTVCMFVRRTCPRFPYLPAPTPHTYIHTYRSHSLTYMHVCPCVCVSISIYMPSCVRFARPCVCIHVCGYSCVSMRLSVWLAVCVYMWERVCPQYQRFFPVRVRARACLDVRILSSGHVCVWL